MNKYNEQHDAMMDENLRKLGSLSRENADRNTWLPETPNDAQRAAWHQGAAGPSAASDAATSQQNGQMRNLPATDAERGRILQLKDRGDKRMRQMRFLTIGGIAAMLAVAAFFMGPGEPKRVEAATILKSLRTDVWNGLVVTMDNVDAEGMLVNGECVVRFSEPQSMARLFGDEKVDGGSNSPTVSSVYFDFAVVGGPDADADVVGLDVEMRGGFAQPETAWVYFRPVALPNAVIEEQPMAGIFANMFKHGMLIDLGNMGDEILGEIQGELDDEFGDDAGVSVDVAADVGTDADAGSENAIEVRVATNVDVDDDDSKQRGPRIMMGDYEVNSQLQDDIKKFMTGDAGPEQIEMLIDELTQHVDKAEVQNRGDGLYVLRAEGLDADDEMVRDAVLEMGYREGSGVEWVEVQNIGSRNGKVLVEFTNETGDEQAISVRQQMIDDGVQNVNLDQLMSSFGATFNAQVNVGK